MAGLKITPETQERVSSLSDAEKALRPYERHLEANGGPGRGAMIAGEANP